MNKYKICSNHLANSKWQPAYLPPPKQVAPDKLKFSEPIEFKIERFDTKEESDNFTFKYLKQIGISKDNIEIR